MVKYLKYMCNKNKCILEKELFMVIMLKNDHSEDKKQNLFSPFKGTECHNFINKMFCVSHLAFELINVNIKNELIGFRY